MAESTINQSLDRARLGRAEGVAQNQRINTRNAGKLASQILLEGPQEGESQQDLLRRAVAPLVENDPSFISQAIGITDPVIKPETGFLTEQVDKDTGERFQQVVSKVPSDARLGAKPVKPPAIKFPKPLTDKAQTEIRDATKAIDNLNFLSEGLGKVIANGDVGIIMGTIQNALVAINAGNPDAQSFQSMSNLVSLGKAKAENGGRPTDVDFKLVRGTMADIRNRPETAVRLVADATANARFYAADIFQSKIIFNPENEEQLRAEAKRVGIDLDNQLAKMKIAKKITGSRKKSLFLLRTVQLLKLSQANPAVAKILSKDQKQEINAMLDKLDKANQSVEDLF